MDQAAIHGGVVEALLKVAVAINKPPRSGPRQSEITTCQTILNNKCLSSLNLIPECEASLDHTSNQKASKNHRLNSNLLRLGKPCEALDRAFRSSRL